MKRLKIARTVYRVSDFLSWQRVKTLTLSPSFQRRPVWPSAAKSLLIDTVVRGLPMPIIYIREGTDMKTLEPAREVVDGQQRLRSLLSFIEPSALIDFNPVRDSFTVLETHNEDIAGRSFSELREETRRYILDYELSVHVLPSDTDDKQVLQIFARLNSTGVKLNAQELRNAQYFGEFKQSMYTLAVEQLTRWREWGIFSEGDIARMSEVELVSDLVLSFSGVRGKTQASINRIYKDKDESFPERAEVERRFRAVMDAIEDTLGTSISDTQFRGQTLFHTLFLFVYDVMWGLGSPLKRTTAAKLPSRLGAALMDASRQISSGEFPDDLSKALRGRTTHRESRTVRLNFLRRVCEIDTS
jgi:hypothetical protein